MTLSSGEDQQMIMETAAKLCERLETKYDFNCEGGPLKNCVEWRELRRIIGSASHLVESGTSDMRDDPPPQSR